MAGVFVIFHPLAAREYRKARKWYNARSSDTALRFVRAVDEALTRIAATPDALPRILGENRYVRVTGFPYILVFRRAGPMPLH